MDWDFFQLVKANNILFEKVFSFVDDALTPDSFRCLFNTCFSPIGNNGREGEELTCLWWEEMIDEKKIPLTNILEFCTGSDEVPPLGFDRKINIMFFNQEDGLRCFPDIPRRVPCRYFFHGQ